MLHFFGNFIAIPDLDTKDASCFFAENPFSYLQLEFQTFAVTGQKPGGVLAELSQIMNIAISSGTRIKFCVRVKLFQTEECLSIVAKIFECEKLRVKESEFLKEFAKNRNETGYAANHQNAVRTRVHFQKLLRVEIMKYFSSAKQEIVTREDGGYHYRPLDSEYAFLGTKRMIERNESPVMTFLCSAPSLCEDVQEIIVYTTI